MNNEEKIKIKDEINSLFEDSMIDADLIGVLRENMENFTDDELFALLDSLHKEQTEMKKAIDHVNEAGKEGDIIWENLENEQRIAADEIIDEMMDEIINPEQKVRAGRISNMEKRMALANTPGEILGALDEVEELRGKEGSYRVEDQKKYIRHLFSGKDKNYLNFLAPSLRGKVEEVFDAMEKDDNTKGIV